MPASNVNRPPGPRNERFFSAWRVLGIFAGKNVCVAGPKRGAASWLPTKFRWKAAFAAAALAFCTAGVSLGQVRGSQEYHAKAAFLAAFPNFIEWPASAFESVQAPLLICVFGDYSFGTALAQQTRGMNIHGRRLEIRWARAEKDLRGCQILFVSRSEASRYARVFKAVQGSSVLTVGETPDFLSSGGAVDFVFDGGNLRFEVNLDAAEEAHLTISSRMLALAEHVTSRVVAQKN